MVARFLSFCVAFAFVLPVGCSKKKLSDRDVRREQLRLNAQKKRAELAPLAGGYRGALMLGSEPQDASLSIEVKDLPENEDGQVDPVLMPTVSGSLRMTYGGGEGLEFFSFGTLKADYDSHQGKLDLVVSNGTFKEINLTLEFRDQSLVGTWTAPSSSASGTAEFKRTDNLNFCIICGLRNCCET